MTAPPDVPLKACAHCGSEAAHLHDYDFDAFVVECRNCGMCTRKCTTSAEAIAAWNRRVQPVVDDAVVERMCAAYEAAGEIAQHERMRAALSVMEKTP